MNTGGCDTCRTPRGIAHANTGLKTALLVKSTHAWIGAAALQQDVITVPRPRLGERGANHGLAMALPAIFGMRDDVFEKAMLAAGA